MHSGKNIVTGKKKKNISLSNVVTLFQMVMDWNRKCIEIIYILFSFKMTLF